MTQDQTTTGTAAEFVDAGTPREFAAALKTAFEAREHAEDTTAAVLSDVAAERVRQDTKWGEQNHPDGTGRPADRAMADHLRERCDRRFTLGIGTWRDILQEEVGEAYAESDPVTLRAELVQVAAVAANWIEALDRRAARLAPSEKPEGTREQREGAVNQRDELAYLLAEEEGFSQPAAIHFLQAAAIQRAGYARIVEFPRRRDRLPRR